MNKYLNISANKWEVIIILNIQLSILKHKNNRITLKKIIIFTVIFFILSIVGWSVHKLPTIWSNFLIPKWNIFLPSAAFTSSKFGKNFPLKCCVFRSLMMTSPYNTSSAYSTKPLAVFLSIKYIINMHSCVISIIED